MGGGLVELISRSSEDSFQISNPEFTYFKKVYKKPTDFLIYPTKKSIGICNNIIKHKLDRYGDFLYGLYLDLDIILEKSISTISKYITYVDKIMIEYGNNMYYIFNYNNLWYITPTTASISNYYKINFNNLINEQNKETYVKPLDNPIYKYTIKYDQPDLTNANFMLFISNLIEKYIYDYYSTYNPLINYISYPDEVKHIIKKSYNNNYDIGVCYAYCNKYGLDFNQYNTIIYNSLILNLISNLLYSSSELIYSFWLEYNNINKETTYSINNEWKVILESYVIKFNIPTNNIIYDNFKRIFLETQQNILKNIEKMNTIDSNIIYGKFEKIQNRFNTISTQIIYSNTLKISNKDSDIYNPIIIIEDISGFNKSLDVTLLYIIIAYEFFDFLNKDNKYFKLWTCEVMLRCYYRYLDTNKFITSVNTSSYKLYYNIFPANPFTYEDFMTSYTEVFNRKSWCITYINDDISDVNELSIETTYNINDYITILIQKPFEINGENIKYTYENGVLNVKSNILNNNFVLKKIFSLPLFDYPNIIYPSNNWRDYIYISFFSSLSFIEPLGSHYYYYVNQYNYKECIPIKWSRDVIDDYIEEPFLISTDTKIYIYIFNNYKYIIRVPTNVSFIYFKIPINEINIYRSAPNDQSKIYYLTTRNAGEYCDDLSVNPSADVYTNNSKLVRNNDFIDYYLYKYKYIINNRIYVVNTKELISGSYKCVITMPSFSGSIYRTKANGEIYYMINVVDSLDFNDDELLIETYSTSNVSLANTLLNIIYEYNKFVYRISFFNDNVYIGSSEEYLIRTRGCTIECSFVNCNKMIIYRRKYNDIQYQKIVETDVSYYYDDLSQGILTELTELNITNDITVEFYEGNMEKKNYYYIIDNNVIGYINNIRVGPYRGYSKIIIFNVPINKSVYRFSLSSIPDGTFKYNNLCEYLGETSSNTFIDMHITCQKEYKNEINNSGNYLNIIQIPSVINEIQYCPKNNSIIDKIYTICTNDTIINNELYVSDPWKLNFDRSYTYILNQNQKYIIIAIPISQSAPNLYNVFNYSCDDNYNNCIEDTYIPYLSKSYLLKHDNDIWLHNIPIEINKSSIVKLNNNNITNLIPIKSNQFYISDKDSIKWLYSSAEDLNHSNINKLKLFIDANKNYSTIMIDMIKMIDEEYINIFLKIFSPTQEFYGLTSIDLIKKIPEYTTCDTSIYSHYIPKLNNSLKINIFKNYISYDLFQLRDYLVDVNSYFINILKYINENFDYIKLTNSKLYTNDLITISTAKKLIEDKFSKIDTLNKPAIVLENEITDTEYILEYNNRKYSSNNFNEYIVPETYSYINYPKYNKKYEYIGVISDKISYINLYENIFIKIENNIIVNLKDLSDGVYKNPQILILNNIKLYKITYIQESIIYKVLHNTLDGELIAKEGNYDYILTNKIIKNYDKKFIVNYKSDIDYSSKIAIYNNKPLSCILNYYTYIENINNAEIIISEYELYNSPEFYIKNGQIVSSNNNVNPYINTFIKIDNLSPQILNKNQLMNGTRYISPSIVIPYNYGNDIDLTYIGEYRIYKIDRNKDISIPTSEIIYIDEFGYKYILTTDIVIDNDIVEYTVNYRASTEYTSDNYIFIYKNEIKQWIANKYTYIKYNFDNIIKITRCQYKLNESAPFHVDNNEILIYNNVQSKLINVFDTINESMKILINNKDPYDTPLSIDYEVPILDDIPLDDIPNGDCWILYDKKYENIEPVRGFHDVPSRLYTLDNHGNYYLTKNNTLFLNIGDSIIVNQSIYIVKNINIEYYILTLYKGDGALDGSSGYIVLNSIISKYDIPVMNYNTSMKYKNDINIGLYVYNTGLLNISTNTRKNCNGMMFDNKYNDTLNLTIINHDIAKKIIEFEFYENYQLNINDIILYNEEICYIVSINFYNKRFKAVYKKSINLNKQDIIKPYQPFDTYYVYINTEGTILIPKYIPDTYFAVFYVDLPESIYIIKNNKILSQQNIPISLDEPEWRWIKTMKTDSEYTFIPTTILQGSYSDERKCRINCDYLMYDIYFGQYIYIDGSYNRIIGIDDYDIILDNIIVPSESFKCIFLKNTSGVRNYYSKYTNFDYNGSIQLYSEDNTNLIKYCIEDDIIKYSNYTNEIVENDNCEYFCKYQNINKNSNYRLLIYEFGGLQQICLCSLIDFKIKLYNNIPDNVNILYLDGIYPCNIILGFISFINLTNNFKEIIIVNTENKNDCNIIISYNITILFGERITIEDSEKNIKYYNRYAIKFADNVDTSKLEGNPVYLDINSEISYNFYRDTNNLNYYVGTEDYFKMNELIYFKIPNKIISSTPAYVQDNSILYNILHGKIYTSCYFRVPIIYIGNINTLYTYEIDCELFENQIYYINKPFFKIEIINPSNKIIKSTIIQLSYKIDVSSGYVNIYNIKCINSIVPLDYTVYKDIYNKERLIEYNINKEHLFYNSKNYTHICLNSFGYSSNYDSERIKLFNKDSSKYTTYKRIENVLFNIVDKWISSKHFFKNYMYVINDFLSSFDSKYFFNKSYISLGDVEEIDVESGDPISYLSSEYIVGLTNVTKDPESQNIILKELSMLNNIPISTYGVSCHKLLRNIVNIIESDEKYNETSNFKFEIDIYYNDDTILYLKVLNKYISKQIINPSVRNNLIIFDIDYYKKPDDILAIESIVKYNVISKNLYIISYDLYVNNADSIVKIYCNDISLNIVSKFNGGLTVNSYQELILGLFKIIYNVTVINFYQEPHKTILNFLNNSLDTIFISEKTYIGDTLIYKGPYYYINGFHKIQKDDKIKKITEMNYNINIINSYQESDKTILLFDSFIDTIFIPEKTFIQDKLLYKDSYYYINGTYDILSDTIIKVFQDVYLNISIINSYEKSNRTILVLNNNILDNLFDLGKIYINNEIIYSDIYYYVEGIHEIIGNYNLEIRTYDDVTYRIKDKYYLLTLEKPVIDTSISYVTNNNSLVYFDNNNIFYSIDLNAKYIIYSTLNSHNLINILPIKYNVVGINNNIFEYSIIPRDEFNLNNLYKLYYNNNSTADDINIINKEYNKIIVRSKFRFIEGQYNFIYQVIIDNSSIDNDKTYIHFLDITAFNYVYIPEKTYIYIPVESATNNFECKKLFKYNDNYIILGKYYNIIGIINVEIRTSDVITTIIKEYYSLTLDKINIDNNITFVTNNNQLVYFTNNNEPYTEDSRCTFIINDKSSNSINLVSTINYYIKLLDYDYCYIYEYNSEIITYLVKNSIDYKNITNLILSNKLLENFNLLNSFPLIITDILNVPNLSLQLGIYEYIHLEQYNYNLIIPEVTTETTAESSISYNTTINNYYELFDYIKIYFNKQLIEELTPLTYDIIYKYHMNLEEKNKFDKLVKIRNNRCILPLLFWFFKYPALFPSCLMDNIDVYLEYKVKTSVNIKVNQEVILVSDLEINQLKSELLNYIIPVYDNYKTINIYSSKIPLYIRGLVRDIYFVFSFRNPKYTIVSDDKYNNYLNVSYIENINNLYNSYNNSNNKNIDFPEEYDLFLSLNGDIDLFKYNLYCKYFNIITNEEYNKLLIDYNNYYIPSTVTYNSFIKSDNVESDFKYENSVYLLCKRNNELFKYLLYYSNKYLNTYTKKYSLLKAYLQNQYINNKTLNIPKINKLNISVDDTDLFYNIDSVYTSTIIPYKIFNQSNYEGYYIYTFSVDPSRHYQSYGYLNYNQFDNSYVNIESDDNDMTLNIMTYNYALLTIKNGVINFI